MIYLHSREMNFLSYISELTGKNAYGRPLISPSRLQRLKKNETLIFHDRCYPFLAIDVPLIFDYPIELGDKMPEKTKKRRSRHKAFDQDEAEIAPRRSRRDGRYVSISTEELFEMLKELDTN